MDLLDTPGLVRVTAIAAIAGWIAARDFPWSVAMAIAAARFAIPTVYFAWYANDGWTLWDDLEYLSQGRQMLARGYDPLTVLMLPDGREFLEAISGGHHILYGWWNALALWLLGDHYWAPVLLNVLVSFAAAWVLGRMLSRLEFGRSYRLACQGLFLLHWDTLAWTSFLNLKDSLVQCMTMVALAALLQFVHDHRRRWLGCLLLVWLAFWFVRFYVPALMLLAAAIWMLTQWSDARKLLLLPLAGLGLWWAWAYLGRHSDLMQWERLAMGAVRFAITPLPWSIEDSYSFLLVPSVLHLLLAVPAALGAWCLWRQSIGARLPLIYAAVVLGFYAVTEDLQGPRHRVQVGFVLIWAQFHAGWTAGAALMARRHPSATLPDPHAQLRLSPRRMAA